MLPLPALVGLVACVVAPEDGAPSVDGDEQTSRFHADADADGWALRDDWVVAVTPPVGYIAPEDDRGNNLWDCDDGDETVHPGAEEICADGLDQDCNGADAEWETRHYDEDGDGYPGTVGVSECELPDGAFTSGTDCDDSDDAVSPGADEVCGDGIDNDCDGDSDAGPWWYADEDGDGYADLTRAEQACDRFDDRLPGGHHDCDDEDADVHPGATELCGDGVDDDCDGVDDAGTWWYRDSDGDGRGDASVALQSCSEPPGYVDDDQDCDDAHAAVSPDSMERCADGVDNDCADGDAPGELTWYADADGDGHGTGDDTLTACVAPSGYVDEADDCDDDDPSVHPEAEEVCGDATDNDCDGSAPGCGLIGGSSVGDFELAWSGEAPGDRAGAQVAWGGDHDGDGLTELLLGAIYNDTMGDAAGAAYLLDASSPTLTAGRAILLGSGSADLAGAAVASGDWDGDGWPDVLVGAPGYYGDSAGAVYAVLGPLTGQVFLQLAEFVVVGGSGKAGNTLARGTDLDGDGVDELVIPVPTTDDIYLFDELVAGTRDVSDFDGGLYATDTREFGAAVDGGVDVDGDGLDDLLVGAPGAGQTGSGGEVFLFLGPISGSTVHTDAEFWWRGHDHERLGGAVAIVSDGNADGRPDLLFGASNAHLDEAKAGQAYAIRELPTRPVGAHVVAEAVVQGSGRYDRVGVSVGRCGDMDGDGVDEVIIGAEMHSDSNTGRVFVIPADVSGVDDVEDAASAWAISETAGGSADSAACIGDWNGDGLDELAVGDDEEGDYRGAGYVLLGGPGP